MHHTQNPVGQGVPYPTCTLNRFSGVLLNPICSAIVAVVVEHEDDKFSPRHGIFWERSREWMNKIVEWKFSKLTFEII